MPLVDKIIEKGKEGLRRYKWPLWLLGSAGFALLTNKLSEGRGPVIYLAIVIIIILVLALHWGDSHAKTNNVRSLFWFWGALAFIFLITILIGKFLIIQSYKVRLHDDDMVCSNLRDQNLALSNSIVETNAFYEPRMTGYTNAISLNWRHNWFGYMAKQLLLAHSYVESAKYWQLCIDVDYQINSSTRYSDGFKTYYYTAYLMTNDSVDHQTIYLDQLSNNNAKLMAAGDLDQLGQIQGQLGEMEEIVPTNLKSNLQGFANEIAEYRQKHR